MTIAPQLGHLNLTALSNGAMGLLHDVQTGSFMLDAIFNTFASSIFNLKKLVVAFIREVNKNGFRKS